MLITCVQCTSPDSMNTININTQDQYFVAFKYSSLRCITCDGFRMLLQRTEGAMMDPYIKIDDHQQLTPSI